ncbi:DUF1194 domain-containing protein [Tianweitania sp. BSSL-BM11]|uniref:DUF1194 domain-containing protein n=1 Tax=Tianweitania aestuarii TaxID=2814886 RepID=A0ABS5RX01_9HYPH|nr:DUF1194 domain-containing protein [Tianweitania aestuarii]MBS9720827.1 DUF1194 domain-containing protein [Tianweitania aestuarii]
MQCVPGFLSGLSRLAVASFAALLLPVAAQAAEPVDVELVLAVDVSLSMSPMELDIQRRGYVAALTHPNVVQAIQDGVHGKIAVTYFEWAGDAMQRVVVPWTVIANQADAEAFAARLEAGVPNSARRTSISAALTFAGDLLAESGFTGMKRVIDISGDGPNNQGEPVDSVRDRITDQGITINGLPLMTSGGRMSGYDFADLDTYYTRCVIGGPGSFMVPVNEWSQFPEAIRRKLVLELAGPFMPIPAAYQGAKPSVLLVQSRDAYDCQIGEKMWGNRSWMWESR